MDFDLTKIDFRDRGGYEFEEHVVTTVLKEFGLGREKYDLLDWQQERTGSKRLTLVAFMQMHPTFPVHLEAHTPPALDKDCNVRRLLNSFKETKLLSLWELGEDSVLEAFRGRPRCVVLKWPRSNVSVALHNSDYDYSSGPRFEFRESSRRFILEPFRRLLKSLAWSPE